MTTTGAGSHVTVSAQLARAVTVSGQLDLAYDPAELRGKDGKWIKSRPGDAAGSLTAQLQPHGEADGQQAAHDVATRGAAAVGGLLGGGTPMLKSVHTVPVKGNESVLASMNWDGSMDVRQDVADGLAKGESTPGATVTDVRPYATILHELIHSAGYAEPGTPEQDRQTMAYQNPHTAVIEEGFTELGTVQHAPDFFDAVGIGDRQTPVIAGNAAHTTMREYAQRLADPQRVASGDGWGHYTGAVMAADDWTQRVAAAEPATRKAGPAAVSNRARELADEINRAGPADKAAVMVQQAIRATGGQPRPGMDMNLFTRGAAGVLTRNWTTGKLDSTGSAAKAWDAMVRAIEAER